MYSKEKGITRASDYYLYFPSAIAARLYLYPVATGHFFYEPGYLRRRNHYDNFLLMHILDGTCTGACQGRPFTASKDQIVLMDCYEPHEYGNMESDTTLEVAWLHFDGPLARSYYEIITASRGNVLTLPNSYPVAHNMRKILRLFRESAPIREASVSAYITQILTELLNGRSDADASTSRSSVIESSLAYINEHFSEPVSLETLAQNSNLSPYYFTRVFTAETGFTPHQYLIATRLNSAKYLLKTPGMSIKEIAFACGFNSESSFCSTFKKWENTTPSEYRAHAAIE
ncbi:MAG: AraC family transcriptional regulator [Lachnospiraceae bacterium]|uniref:helix-turn-helix transcriptional regulator n=1 Tax=Parablautia sp. Marseille-Q6255 TaxID=3039593 RepID=UPI0024BC1115|nr:AraC family transcriptional regulator [Parablautia sp. Marseille-Q6255]